MKNQNHIDPSTSSGTSPTSAKPAIHMPKPVRKSLAGSYLSGPQLPEATPETVPARKKRGRKPKYKNDEERRTADAARKRDDRLTEKANEIIAAHPDHLGSHGESSGGHGMTKMAEIDDRIQANEAALGGGVPDHRSTPDRRHVSVVPVNPDNDESSTKETDDTFIDNAMRRATRKLREWIRRQPRKCSQDHIRLADKYKDSKEKVTCRTCGKMLVNPGKVVKGIPNLSDSP